MTTDLMIQAEGLQKRYGDTQALAGVSFDVPAGTILGLLGPNGAGKTTAVRVLTTLAVPDSGTATVAGIDVVKHPNEVRRHIGVAAQDATLDGLLTGRQNLTLVGELCDMARGAAKARAAELLERFELTYAADRVLKGYSGGMRRRLDLAASLMTRPPVLFLDEPTTGLDPTSRQRVWDAIRELLDEGVTVLLTTQYLEEADELANRIVVVNHGLVIADGTPQELKEASRSARVEVTLATPSAAAVPAIAGLVAGQVHVSEDGRQLSAGVDSSPGLATTLVRALDAAGVLVDNIEVRQPSLDDVFFTLTGDHIEEDVAGDDGVDGEDGGGGGGRGPPVFARRWTGAAGPLSWKERTPDDDDDLDPSAGAGGQPQVGRPARPSRRRVGDDPAEPGAHLAGADAALGRDHPAGVVHLSVRVRLRWGDPHPRWWLLQGLPAGRHFGAEPRHLGDGDSGRVVDRLARRDDRPLPGPANLAASRLDGPVGGGLHDIVPVRADRGADRPGGRVAVGRQHAGHPGRVPAGAVLRLLTDMGRPVRGVERQEPGVGGLVRFYRAVPFGVRLQRHGADGAHAGLDAGHRGLEPRLGGLRRRAGSVGQPEPVARDQRVADATPGGGVVDLVGGHHRHRRPAGVVLLQQALHGLTGLVPQRKV